MSYLKVFSSCNEIDHLFVFFNNYVENVYLCGYLVHITMWCAINNKTTTKMSPNGDGQIEYEKSRELINYTIDGYRQKQLSLKTLDFLNVIVVISRVELKF